MPLIAFLPTFFNVVVLIVIFLSALALENASFPMETTFLPMITFFNLVHPANAFAEIFVTRKEYTTPFAFTFTVAGIAADLIFLLAAVR